MKIPLLIVGFLAAVALADGSNRLFFVIFYTKLDIFSRVVKRNALFLSKLHREGRMQKFEQSKVNDAKTNVEVAQAEAKSVSF